MDNPTDSQAPRKAAKTVDKPPKPYPDFPLTPHNSGAWMKKINGNIHYFGKWGRVVGGKLTRIQEDGCWADALKLYQAQAEDLHAGRAPRSNRSNAGDAGQNKLTGSEFKKPDKAVLRKHRARNGERMLEADELRKLLNAAAVPIKAMILLGINAGFGNHDVATLPRSALNLERGWLNYPRPKTGVGRRCPLWPETTAAIKAALAARPKPRDQSDKDIVFLMSTGRRWVRNTEKSRTDNLSVCFGELMKKLGIHDKGIGFHVLRHVFRTIADAARDPVAIDHIMGLSDPSMGGHYRERIDDGRLQAVAMHVHDWLFGKPTGTNGDAQADVKTETDYQAPPG